MEDMTSGGSFTHVTKNIRDVSDIYLVGEIAATYTFSFTDFAILLRELTQQSDRMMLAAKAAAIAAATQKAATDKLAADKLAADKLAVWNTLNKFELATKEASTVTFPIMSLSGIDFSGLNFKFSGF